MHDVEMDEGEARPSPARAAGRWGLRRSWPLAAVLTVAVLGGLAFTQSVLDATERARITRVQALPGVVRPLGPSVHPLWRSDGASRAVTGGVLLAGRFIGGRLGSDGTQAIEAIDAATGAVAWSTAVTGPDPNVASDPSLPPQCALAQQLVVCLVVADYQLTAGTVAPTYLAPRHTRIVVLDPRPGTILAERETAVSATLAVEGDLAVIGWVAADGHAVVTGTDPRTGDIRWTFRTPTPMQARPGERLGLDVTAVGGSLVVASWSHKLWLLSAAGTLLRELPGGDGSPWFAAVRTGVLALRTSEGSGKARTTVVVDGRDQRGFDGEPARLTVDDGSAPGLIFTGGAPLVAWDVATGQRRWSSAASTGRNLVLIDGTLYSATNDAVLAIDAQTGGVRWTSPAPLHSDMAAVLTDGTVLVAVEQSPDPRLAAFDLADGQRVWQAGLPAQVDNLLEVQGRLFATRTSKSTVEVTALG